MLTVLIADDEPYVRCGIKNIIPWNENGFTICSEGINGNDTYNKILELNPDLVLIDIKMPGKSGLEVIKDSVEKGFKGRFIIISGHSEFNYAKEAIKYGVKMYLLKPLDEDELLNIIISLKEEICEEININKNNNAKMKLIKEHVLCQLCLNNIIHESQEIEKSINAESIIVALICNYKDSFYNNDIIKLENCVKRRLLINNLEILKVKDNVAVMFYDKDFKLVNSILENIKTQIEEELQQKVFITIGSNVSNIKDINVSYSIAESLMDKRYIYLTEGIISEEKIKKYKEKKYLSEKLILENLYTSIEIGEISNVKKLLLQLEYVIMGKGYNEDTVKMLLTTSFINLMQKIITNYKTNKNFDEENATIIEEIHNKGSLHDIINFLIEELSFISKTIGIASTDNGIKRIIRYVDNKYYCDLKLESLAEIFGYNSSYLGKLFKENTGKSFNTYLDILRIDKAKELLVEDRLKVYQVCEKVGYKNIDYFYSKFKRYVGISPSNYKKTLDVKKEKMIL